MNNEHFTSFDLKIIAVITMTIDHIGYFLFPDVEWLRVIGRISFPIFAFLCAQSYRYTHDKKTYLIRMLIFGTVITIAKYFLNYQVIEADIFITLGLGFAMLWLADSKYWYLSFIPLLLGMAINTEYYWFGIVLVPLFYYGEDYKWAYVPGLLILSYLYVLSSQYFATISYDWFAPVFESSFLQVYCAIAGLFLIWYNKKPGYQGNKYFFYLYYPLHVIIINVIGMAVK